MHKTFQPVVVVLSTYRIWKVRKETVYKSRKFKAAQWGSASLSKLGAFLFESWDLGSKFVLRSPVNFKSKKRSAIISCLPVSSLELALGQPKIDKKWTCSKSLSLLFQECCICSKSTIVTQDQRHWHVLCYIFYALKTLNITLNITSHKVRYGLQKIYSRHYKMILEPAVLPVKFMNGWQIWGIGKLWQFRTLLSKVTLTTVTVLFKACETS